MEIRLPDPETGIKGEKIKDTFKGISYIGSNEPVWEGEDHTEDFKVTLNFKRKRTKLNVLKCRVFGHKFSDDGRAWIGDYVLCGRCNEKITFYWLMGDKSKRRKW